MQREQLIVGQRTYLHYYRENVTRPPGRVWIETTIWMDAFLRWAKRDLGPELPKEQG